MNEYLKVKNSLEEADAIVIGAGAGLSTSAGIHYDETEFLEKFPELVSNYGMKDMYTSSFYSFQTEEERWSYWSKHIDYLYNIEARDVYVKLLELVKEKNYFVITTNVDGQFLKAGFDKEHVFEVQGTLSKMQCSFGCHDTLYDDLKLVKEMMAYHKEIKVPSTLIPHCPKCGEKMEINLRKDAFFVEDDHFRKQNSRYEQFLRDNKKKKVVFLELGVGFNTPGIIRFPFEQFVYTYHQATLIRINDKYTDVPFEIQDKSITLRGDCKSVIEKISNQK